MKRLIVICEGETEQEFCQDVLLPYFVTKGIYLQYPTIKKSSGGIVAWEGLKRQIENHLKGDASAIVSTLVDFYGIQKKHNYPNFENAYRSDVEKVDNIQLGMLNNVDEKLRSRFIPYIQLHEFECFVFCSLDVLKSNFKTSEANFSEIEKVIIQFPNVEDINNGAQTAPSKRLEENIKGYNKPVFGACLTSSIGLEKIREKCPRFSAWIKQLANIGD